jgi:hypothetical protein
LVKSFSRDNPEKRHVLEVWNMPECMLESAESVLTHVEPEYEWGLNKWEFCDNEAEVSKTLVSERREIYVGYAERDRKTVEEYLRLFGTS